MNFIGMLIKKKARGSGYVAILIEARTGTGTLNWKTKLEF